MSNRTTKLLVNGTFAFPYNQTDGVFFEKGPDDAPLHHSLVVLVVELTVAGLGVFFNVMVLLTITCSKHVQGSNTTKYIISLCVSDLLICAFVMTLNAFLQLGKLKHVSSNLSVNICYAMDSFNVIALTSSSLLVLAIAIDRYTCVANPSYYYTHITNTKIAIILILVWTFSVLLAVLPFLLGGVRLYKPDLCLMEVTPTYQVAMVVTIIFIPCLIICVIYSTIFLSAYDHIRVSRSHPPLYTLTSTTTTSNEQQQETDGRSRQTPTNTNTKSSPSSKSSGMFNLDFTAHVNFIEDAAIEDGNYLSRRVRRSLKSSFMQKIGSSGAYATVMMCLVVGVFVIHWLPYGIVNFIDAIQPHLIPTFVDRALMWLLLMNSCWNPIIYAFSNSLVRHDMFRVLCCQCTNKESVNTNPKQAANTKTSIMFSGLDQPVSDQSLNLDQRQKSVEFYIQNDSENEGFETEV